MKRLVLTAAVALLSFDALAVGRVADVTVIDRDSGRTLPTYYHRGEYWVAGTPGARYGIEVHNRTTERLLAVMAVDGVNVVPAVHDVSWELPPGGCVAFVGESGGGKTTILDLVTGLMIPTSGQVALDGRDLRELDLEAWRHRVGFVMQDAPIFFGTVVENIAWGSATPDRARAEEAADLAHLGDVLRAMPEGLDTHLGQRGARLSGGQRQRVALARALYREPWLLVLDEATSALDSDSERVIHDALVSLKGECSMLVVAHRIKTVALADRILVLQGGRVVEDGSWDALMAADGAFRKMAAAQGIESSTTAPGSGA